MNLDVTHGAIFVGLQVAHDAGFADLGCGQKEDNQNPLSAQAYASIRPSLPTRTPELRTAPRPKVAVCSHIWPVAPCPPLGPMSLCETGGCPFPA